MPGFACWIWVGSKLRPSQALYWLSQLPHNIKFSKLSIYCKIKKATKLPTELCIHESWLYRNSYNRVGVSAVFVLRTQLCRMTGKERATQQPYRAWEFQRHYRWLHILSLHLNSEPNEKVFKFLQNLTEVGDFHLRFFPLRTSEEYGCVTLTHITNNHPYH